MDWTKFITDLFAAGVGGLIGGTLGAYFKSYWTEKGKNLATYKDIEFLLGQERGKAYQQEAGKRLATHDDIENVLKEVQAVTEKTETIKAQIGSDQWTRQRVWEQKREAYFNLLKVAHDFLNAMDGLVSALNIYQKHWAGENLEAAQAQVKTSTAKYVEAQAPFLDMLLEAQVFVSSMAIEHLREGRGNNHLSVYGDLAHPQEQGRGQGAVVQARQYLQTWTVNLVFLARQDLGVREI